MAQALEEVSVRVGRLISPKLALALGAAASRDL